MIKARAAKSGALSRIAFAARSQVMQAGLPQADGRPGVRRESIESGYADVLVAFDESLQGSGPTIAGRRKKSRNFRGFHDAQNLAINEWYIDLGNLRPDNQR
jgi:hypothetical protein